MSPELTRKLVEKYPKIFQLVTDPGPDPKHCISLFQFECGDGWFNILDALCSLIQSHIDQRQRDIDRISSMNHMVAEYAYGNRDPLLEYCRHNEKSVNFWAQSGFQQVPLPIAQVTATQVKEKYGGLRFYYNGGDDYVSAVVDMAEVMSDRTCEVCGAPGKPNSHGWIVTRCDQHAA